MPLVNAMAQGPSLYLYIKNLQKYLLNLFTFLFIFIYPILAELILASNEFKGIDNPLARVGCKYLLLCVYVLFMRIYVVLLLDWYLSSHWGNTYLYCAASPLLFGEIPTQFTSSRKNFWRCCRGDITKTYQVPSHKLESTCIYFIFLFFHLPLIFISTTSKTILQKHKNILFACLLLLPLCQHT